MNIRLVVAAAIAFMLSACNNRPSFSTYEDCILANVGSSQSTAAVKVIRDACRAKFPSPAPTQEDLAQTVDASTAAQEAADAAAAAADAQATAAAQASADAAAAAADAAASKPE